MEVTYGRLGREKTEKIEKTEKTEKMEKMEKSNNIGLSWEMELHATWSGSSSTSFSQGIPG
jgi:hypothetical protein